MNCSSQDSLKYGLIREVSSDSDLHNFLMSVGEVLAVLFSVDGDESSLPSVSEGVDAGQLVVSWSQGAVLLDQALLVFDFAMAINWALDFVFHFNSVRNLEAHVSAGYDGEGDTVQDKFHFRKLIINKNVSLEQ